MSQKRPSTRGNPDRRHQTQLPAPQANLPVAVGWESVHRNFTAVWIADGSTLEALKKKLQALQEPATPLAGKMMMVVEAFHHRPVATWYTTDAKANDKTFADQLLTRLPLGGLLIFDLGFFSFVWFVDTNGRALPLLYAGFVRKSYME